MKSGWILTLLICLVQFAGCKKPATSSPIAISTISANQIDFQTVEVDLSNTDLKLFYKNPNGTRFSNFDALAKYLDNSNKHLLFATNAGMFEPGFLPCGLMVSDGKEISPLNLRDGSGNFYLKPNGVFMISDGRAKIVNSTQYGLAGGVVSLATQSGPLLVNHGQINTLFNSNSDNRKIRSGVGVRDSGVVVFAISKASVTFDEFAKLFRDQLHCPDALYLDGVISRFYLPGENSESQGQDFAGILAVTARQ